MWKLLLYLLSLTVVAALLLSLVAGNYHEFLVWLPAVPVVFFIIGYASDQILQKVAARYTERLIGTYLGIHIVKLVVIALLAAFYIGIMDANAWQFLPTLLVFYLVHLVWETKLFFATERKIRLRKGEQTETPLKKDIEE